MKKFLRYIAAVIVAAFIFPICHAQVKTDGKSATVDDKIRIDNTIWDFGEVLQEQGPLSCTFNIENISDEPIVIYNVVSSCGCTEAKWTREPLRHGMSGKISVTYSNDEGPYPFDKTITAYISGIKKPVVLRLRGVVRAKKLPLSEIYTEHKGALGLKKTDIKLGNMSQGSQRSDAATVANLSQSPINVSFADVTPGLNISVSPNPIPAGQTAKMTYIVTADRTKWGKNYYYAAPVVNGKKYSPIDIWTFTKEDFSDWTKNQIDNGAQPIFDSSSFDFGTVRKGAKLTATFPVKNLGGSTLVIHKADSDTKAVNIPSEIADIPSGDKAVISMPIDTSQLPAGDASIVVILTTNSPLRPIVNLYIVGKVI